MEKKSPFPTLTKYSKKQCRVCEIKFFPGHHIDIYCDCLTPVTYDDDVMNVADGIFQMSRCSSPHSRGLRCNLFKNVSNIICPLNSFENLIKK